MTMGGKGEKKKEKENSPEVDSLVVRSCSKEAAMAALMTRALPGGCFPSGRIREEEKSKQKEKKSATNDEYGKRTRGRG